MSLEEVRARIGAACSRSGRDPSTVKLIAVTKGHAVEEVERVVLERGHLILGESRIQEWREKAEALGRDDLEWHFIGNLQRNKVKYCLPFHAIHSLNSERLADALERQGSKSGHRFRVLVEVNVAGEETKQGAELEVAEGLVHRARSLSHVEVIGLMTMAPYAADPEAVRPVFARLRGLRDKLGLQELSMGMSNDYEVAVEEGATMVRVGSALFRGEPS